MGSKLNESWLSKLETFNRKKKDRMEVMELAKESSLAIRIPTSTVFFLEPKDYELEEGQERFFIAKSSEVLFPCTI